jgi:hypothetical protein
MVGAEMIGYVLTCVQWRCRERVWKPPKRAQCQQKRDSVLQSFKLPKLRRNRQRLHNHPNHHAHTQAEKEAEVKLIEAQKADKQRENDILQQLEAERLRQIQEEEEKERQEKERLCLWIHAS